jgi:two-component system nitrogen regulation response regulator GlnG
VLLRHPWPGNVRELENVIYRSAVIAQGDTILWKDLPPEIREAAGAGGGATPPPAGPAVTPPAQTMVDEVPPMGVAAESAMEPAVNRGAPDPAPVVPAVSPLTLNDALDFVYARLKAEDKEPVLERLEREMIARVLKDENGNLVRASERLGMTRTTLRKRIDALGLKV